MRMDVLKHTWYYESASLHLHLCDGKQVLRQGGGE